MRTEEEREERVAIPFVGYDLAIAALGLWGLGVAIPFVGYVYPLDYDFVIRHYCVAIPFVGYVDRSG